ICCVFAKLSILRNLPLNPKGLHLWPGRPLALGAEVRALFFMSSLPAGRLAGGCLLCLMACRFRWQHGADPTERYGPPCRPRARPRFAARARAITACSSSFRAWPQCGQIMASFMVGNTAWGNGSGQFDLRAEMPRCVKAPFRNDGIVIIGNRRLCLRYDLGRK